MLDYTIKFSLTDNAARLAIDSCVHAAVTRFRDELGDKEGLAYRIARAAATSALEQFKAMCNSELRLIAADHERRAGELMLRPSPPFIMPAQGIETAPADETPKAAQPEG